MKVTVNYDVIHCSGMKMVVKFYQVIYYFLLFLHNTTHNFTIIAINTINIF